jgi:hypothetical protein
MTIRKLARMLLLDLFVAQTGDLKDEFCTTIKIDANSQRARSARLMNGKAHQQLSANL